MPFGSCSRLSISRLAKSLKSPLSLVTRNGEELGQDANSVGIVTYDYLLSYSRYQAIEGTLCLS